MKKKITLTCVWLLCLIWSKGNAQTQFWSDTFEDATAPSAGTRTPSLNTGGGGPPLTYYFMRTDGTNLDLQGVPGGAPETATTYVSKQGTWFWAGEDTDRVRTGTNDAADKVQNITWSGINISGKTGLSFKGLFAANNNHEWQDISLFPATFDFIEVEYRIDGGSWNLAGGMYAETAPSGGYIYKRLRLDTNQDKIGDGTFLSRIFQEFGWTITGTGTLLDLRFRVSADAGATQEFAIDNFRLFETAACTAPVVTANPPNRSICVNGNTTFTAAATGATAYQWQVNTGSGFTDITNGGVYSNATTNVLTITGATAGMSGYQYRCKTINGVATCFTNSNNATLNISNITSPTAKNDVLCFGNSSGSAAVSPNGGIGSYTYSWSPSGGTASIATGLAAGTYTVTITDAITCQITKTITINQPVAALSLSTGGGKTDVSCNGGSNGTASVAPTGGTPSYTYSWSPSGGTAATATGLGVGVYTVTVTDANNCQATRSFTITQPTALNATISKTDISCNGGANGTATVSATGGTPSYTYSWSPAGGTNATATGLATGTYTCTITDANSCQITRTVTINQPATALSLSIGGGQTNVSCNGGSNGTASVAPTGGTPSYTYSWAPSGGTAATASGLAAGTYTVTVTDANSCQATRLFTITQPTALNATISKTDISCNGGANGTATVSATGGTPSYTYSWSPAGGTNATATGLATGTHTCTITDANSCQITRTVTINQPATALSLSTGGGQTNVSCNGGSNGTASVAPTGGTPSYTYSWAPSGGTAATASGLAAGTYTVTVTDANSCQATRLFTITQPTALNATISKTDISCNGGANGTATVSATGGTPSYTYSWSPAGGTNATATGLATGTYTCTITDANSCQITRTVTINQPATALSLSTGGGQTNVSCNGGSNGTASVAPTGGTPSYTYSWAPSGGTAATATGLTAGTYTVTVTDANSCQVQRTFTITQPTVLSAATGGGQTNVSCNSGANGTATVAPTGGTPGYTYSWAPSGGTNATATGLTAGTYTVTVTDANSCQVQRTFTITQPTVLSAATDGAQTNASCNSGANGTATVAPTGGTPGYTYSWAPSGGTNATATGLTAGTYTVTVTDANSCQVQRTFTITQPTVLSAATGGGQTNVSCNSGANGTATVAPTGGTPGYTYSWAPSGGTNATATGLTAGTYTVTVTDANSCQVQRTFTITQPTVLSAATGGAQTNVSCNSGANGTATVAPTGGTPGYTYSWAPSGGTNATATGLTAGTYTVTVTDANSCQTTRTFTITQPTALSASTGGAQTNVSCNGGANGTATVAPTGGTPGYTYSWSPSGGTSATATGLTAGTYTVTVTDANSCQTTRTFTITQPSALTATASSTDVSCNGGTNGTATVAASGGTGAYTYSWAPSGGTAATATGLTAGTYTVTITDANTCQITRSVTITQPAAIISTTTLNNGVITANQSGATYQWIQCPATILTGENGQSYTPTAIGSYAVVITVGACSVVSSCVVVNTLSNPDFEDNSKFIMYPNPSQGIVNIQFGYDGDFQVINQLGQIVRTFKIEANVINTIDLQNLSDSIYFIKQMNTTKTKTHRLIIKK